MIGGCASGITICSASEIFLICSFAVAKHNRIYRLQLPKITPHVCSHTYCSNMAKSGMKPKTLQYLMGNSDISVTMNTYTHLGLQDAWEELHRLEALNSQEKARNNAAYSV